MFAQPGDAGDGCRWARGRPEHEWERRLFGPTPRTPVEGDHPAALAVHGIVEQAGDESGALVLDGQFDRHARRVQLVDPHRRRLGAEEVLEKLLGGLLALALARPQRW